MMRLLHTSDWHLGQTLHGHERSAEHQAFLDWLLDTLESENVDVLLIAGDVFDTANPSSAAQRQWYGFLAAAHRRIPGLSVVVIAGNHDSPGRLEAPHPFYALCQVNVVGQTVRDAQGEIDLSQLVLPLRDRQGETRAWALAVPFLRPGDVPRAQAAPASAETAEARADAQGETPGAAFQDAIVDLYRRVQAYAETRRAPQQALVALGHCHMRDGQVSEDSERRLVGGAEALPAAMFDDAVAYAALGHLHFPQAVGARAHIRYSGSPLPLSFNEMHYPHQVVCVDLDGAQAGAIRPLRVPRQVELLSVPARPLPPDEALAALAAMTLPPLDPADIASWPYLQVQVRLDAPEPGLRARIDAALAGRPVRLCRIRTEYGGAARDAAHVSLDALDALDPAQVFARVYRRRYGTEAPPDYAQAFAEIVDETLREDPA